MAGDGHRLQSGKAGIGRQVVLPFSKAFEIAWKSIRIRIWRSLITMVGIILAIAFLMSVWTGGAVTNALESVSEDDERYGLIQEALRRRAIARESVSIRVGVIGAETVRVPGLKAAPYMIIHDSLQERQECQPFLLGQSDEFKRSLRAEAGDQERPDALVITSLPGVLANQEGIAAIEEFVKTGGTLVVFGYDQLWLEGADDAARKMLDALLPARVVDGEVRTSGGTIEPGKHHAAAQVAWQTHPEVVLLKTAPLPQAEALARVGEQGIVWIGEHGDGTVLWYPIAGSAAPYVSALEWFKDGRLLVSALRWGAREQLRGGSGGVRNTWLVGLSLLVCIVGITNAMLMSVTERFREIGTMKCLGALDKFVVRLFLIESSLQGAVGSLAGAVVGFALAFVRALFAYRITDPATERTYWFALQYFPWLAVLLWVAVAVVVGMALSVVAAVYPAYRAARMEPVEAMRVQA